MSAQSTFHTRCSSGEVGGDGLFSGGSCWQGELTRLQVQVPPLPHADHVTLSGAFNLSLLQSPELQSEKDSLGGFSEFTGVKVFSRVPSAEV